VSTAIEDAACVTARVAVCVELL
jgi:hypothetical protein